MHCKLDDAMKSEMSSDFIYCNVFPGLGRVTLVAPPTCAGGCFVMLESTAKGEREQSPFSEQPHPVSEGAWGASKWSKVNSLKIL
jgi:hypothetical protein